MTIFPDKSGGKIILLRPINEEKITSCVLTTHFQPKHHLSDHTKPSFGPNNTKMLYGKQ
jgi:hypothetical protein